MNDTPYVPRVFLSHASEDKASFAEPLGKALAARGIRPWLDKWEIRPGDSLVQKLFDEGIGRADAVVVIVSPISSTKSWVREELDSATVSRVVKGTRLIPVRLEEAPVPEPLRHLVWIEAKRTQDGVIDAADGIATAVHARPSSPSVGTRPTYLDEASHIPGLTPIDVFVLTAVVREALTTGHLMPLNWSHIETNLREAGLPSRALKESLHALAEADFINLSLHGEHVYRVDLTHYGFSAAAPSVVPDIDFVHRQIVAHLVNDRPVETATLIQDLAKELSAPRLVVDELLHKLENRNLVVLSRTMGDHCRLVRISPTLGRLLS